MQQRDTGTQTLQLYPVRILAPHEWVHDVLHGSVMMEAQRSEI